jgi:PAS domain S-box-containing protein
MAEKLTYEELEQRVKELEHTVLKCKPAEEALIESEKLHRLILENVTDIIWIVDIKMKFTYFSPSVTQVRGYSVKEAMAQSVEESMTPASFESTMKMIAEELELHNKMERDPNRSRKIEAELTCKDGSTVWTEIEANFVYNSEGQPTGIIGITRNITERKESEKERKRAEEKLRESEEKYRNLVENINDVIFSTDENGNMTYVSPVVKTLIGYDPSEITGRNFSEFIHKDDLPYVLNRFQEILSGELESGEYRLLAKTGEYRWIRSSSSPVYKGDNIAGLRGIFTDITEQKHLEDQLRQSHKMEAIGTLAGGIAHEFNNILGIIIGNTELAIDDVPEWNPAKDCLEEIRSASLRAKDVVRHIMSFSRKSHIERKPLPMSPIIRDAFKLLRASLPSNIDIRQDIYCERDTILANPPQISQVLVNICINSAHAMRAEGGLLEVKLEDVLLDEETVAQYEVLSPGNYVKLTVKDTGHGIKPENLDRIFDPYFTTKGVGEGTGMGLAVVHGIVKSHDGAIAVNSEPDKGTVVEVLLPITEDEIKPEVVEPKDLPTGNEKILFVDDEASLVNLSKQRLEHLGYQVEAMTNPDEALELFRSKPDEFDLVISDMTMPQMTGDKLAQKLMEIRPDIPIIISTGFSEKMDEDKAKEMGIKAVTMKPYEMQTLALTIRKILDEK